MHVSLRLLLLELDLNLVRIHFLLVVNLLWTAQQLMVFVATRSHEHNQLPRHLEQNRGWRHRESSWPTTEVGSTQL